MNIKALLRSHIPFFILDFYHYAFALAGAMVFWFPSRKLIVIGVTGTSGKSTTVDFIAMILEEAGYKTAFASSIRFKIGQKEWKNNLKMTMPGRFMIQKFLRQAVHGGCKYAVLEVTSEGIRQHRHRFINFETAVFTNLSPEHIESHGGFENYRNEKLKLFKENQSIHIINIDDPHAEYFAKTPAKETWFYKVKDKELNLHFKNDASHIIEAEEIKAHKDGISFKVQGMDLKIPLLGAFNVYNALAAIVVGISQGIPPKICKAALEKVKTMPGRMEIVSDKPLVVIDYAHTPEQLEKVYKALSQSISPQSLNSKLICVLGSCGGGRDKWKRPVLGRLASQYCNEIILTNEDPYDEDPRQILSDIKSGISNTQFPISNVYEILDRKKAIKKAIKLASPEDVVIITGKGSEPLMCIENGKKIPWDDRQIAREALLYKEQVAF